MKAFLTIMALLISSYAQAFDYYGVTPQGVRCGLDLYGDGSGYGGKVVEWETTGLQVPRPFRFMTASPGDMYTEGRTLFMSGSGYAPELEYTGKHIACEAQVKFIPNGTSIQPVAIHSTCTMRYDPWIHPKTPMSYDFQCLNLQPAKK